MPSLIQRCSQDPRLAQEILQSDPGLPWVGVSLSSVDGLQLEASEVRQLSYALEWNQHPQATRQQLRTVHEDVCDNHQDRHLGVN